MLRLLTAITALAATTLACVDWLAPESPAWRPPAARIAVASAITPNVPAPRRISVLPVFFVTSDATLPEPGRAATQVRDHLELARVHYRELLGTTFAISDEPISIVRSRHPSSYFIEVQPDSREDRAHRILRELFAWQGTDRYDTDVVFLTIFVSNRGEPIGGGGRPFNGAPGTGGGYVEMDHASLIADRGYPFQSTLVHELGHAFGLTHVDCLGYDLMTNDSIMSYAPSHWSSGLSRSSTPGTLMPEDRYALSLNQGVFPGLRYDGSAVDTARVQACFIGAMSQSVGAYRDLPGVGYELYFDGARVNGPDASLYSRAQAESNCRHHRSSLEGLQVECRYNGAPF